MAQDAYQKYPRDAEKLLGDITLKSSDRRLQKMGINVGRIMVFFP
jgi:hypothetical protein